MQSDRTLTEWALLLILVAMWGSAFMFNKLGVATVPPLTLVAGRISTGAVILLLLLAARGLRLPAFGAGWGAYLILGVVGNVVPFFLITSGQRAIDSALAGILMAGMPLATLVLAHFFVRGEHLTWGRVAGFLLGFMGIVLLFEPAAVSNMAGSTVQVLAQLSVLCGALCYAANSVIARLLVKSDFLVASAATLLISTIVVVPLALIVDAPWTSRPSAASVAAIVWLGVGPTAIATIVYFRLIGSAGPTFMSLVNYLSPAIAVLLGVMLLDETPGVHAYAGLGLILLGVALSQWRRST